ncbi:MAG TPA: hypothetical protein PKE63_01590 [Lacibacter sp.]|nr:hypothetical protein [Lacibacter sp.]HMO88866.1 hypothetical protein [Lacibacter sp.]HMP85936.1 hypothetical protein [Lacibacter sp.]
MSQRNLLLFLFAGTLIMTLLMRWHGAPLSRFPESPAGIVSLELAKTKATTAAILSAWRERPVPNTIARARQNTWLDFAFILFYSLFLYTACTVVARSFHPAHQSAAYSLALLPLLAGLLDVLENAGMLWQLSRGAEEWMARATWCCALLKFTLLLAVVVWLICSPVWIWLGKLQKG